MVTRFSPGSPVSKAKTLVCRCAGRDNKGRPTCRPRGDGGEVSTLGPRFSRIKQKDYSPDSIPFQALACVLAQWVRSSLKTGVGKILPAGRRRSWTVQALPIILCFGLIKTLEDVSNHPQALERLERKLTTLRNKLLERKDR
jgi:hypothetical protein